MPSTRREFLHRSALAALAGVTARGAFAAPKPGRTLLILGGTGFLGPHVVDAARAAGFTVTLFHRGKTQPHLFPDLEKIHGDRDTDLDRLKGRTWDAVIDTSGYVPRQVKEAARVLSGNIGRYAFISTVSVYAEENGRGLNEEAVVGRLLAQTVDAATSRAHVTGATYGPLKALCEEEARNAFGERALVVRPGLIVGPGDTTDRFTYWPVRMARGGEVLAPVGPQQPTQFIDARDLARWTVRLVADDRGGTYNAVGLPVPFGTLLDACRPAPGAAARVTWVDAEFLAEQKVAPYSDLPLWLPLVPDPQNRPRIDVSRALKNGLTFRPAAETARDTLAWWRTLPPERQAKPRAGLSAERETALLTAWHARKDAGR